MQDILNEQSALYPFCSWFWPDAEGKSPGNAWEVLADFTCPFGLEMLSLVLLVDIAGLLSPKLFEKLLQKKKQETIQLDEQTVRRKQFTDRWTTQAFYHLNLTNRETWLVEKGRVTF